MPDYTIVLSKKAKKQLDKITDDIATPIFDAIGNPRPFGYIKLKDREGYRIRVGNYRIIYDIVHKELIIDVITIGHRKDIYD